MKIILAFILMLFLILNISAQSPEFTWVKQGGHGSFVEGNMQVINTNSGIVAAGDFMETGQFGDEEIISNGATDIFIAKFNDAGEVQQIQTFGSENEEFLKYFKIDNEGNIVISIIFTDFISIQGEDFTSLGGQDILLIKLNPEFDIQWIRHYGTGLTDYIKGMDIDNEDNILVFGKFKNDLIFQDITISSMGSTDLYIAKYNSEGEVIFAFSEGGSSYEDANSLAVGSNGDYYFSGTFYGETIINNETISTDNSTGIYLAKYNSTSEFQWVEIIEGTKLSPSCFLAANNTGDVFIAGSFEEEVIFGDNTLTTPEFDPDVYIGKYNSNGEAQWGGQGNSNSNEVVKALNCDAEGNIYLSGKFLAEINFNGIILEYTLC